MDYRDEFDALIRTARNTSGDSFVQFVEQAIKLADKHQDIQLGFEARELMVNKAGDNGHWELVPIHFPWLLAMAEKHPDLFDEEDVLWEYLSAVQSLAFFTRVSKSMILEAQRDLRDRFTKAGMDVGHVLHIEFVNAAEMGDFPLAQEIMEKMEASDVGSVDFGKTEYSFELYCRGWFQVLQGNFEAGLTDLYEIIENREWDPILYAFALSIALPALLQTGRTAEIPEIYRKCVKEIKGKKSMIEPYAEFMKFLGMSGNTAKILQFFPEFATFGEEILNDLDHLRYLQNARFCLEVVRRELPQNVQLQLPKIHPAYRESGKYELPTLVDHYYQRAKELATRFDLRNENEYYQTGLANSLNWPDNPYPFIIK